MANTTFKIKNYFQPTPKNMQIMGDGILTLTLVVQGSAAGMPVSDNTKYWIVFIAGILGYFGKFITKMFKANPPEVAVPQSTLTSLQEKIIENK